MSGSAPKKQPANPVNPGTTVNDLNGGRSETYHRQSSSHKTRNQHVAGVDQHLITSKLSDEVLRDGPSGIKSSQRPSVPIPSVMQQVKPPLGKVGGVQFLYVCQICLAKCYSEASIHSHLGGKRHRTKVLVMALKKSSRLKGAQDHTEITIKPSADLKVVEQDDQFDVVCDTNQSVATFVISNKSARVLTLIHCDLLNLRFNSRTFRLDQPVQREIAPGQAMEVQLHTNMSHIGRYSTHLAFLFTCPTDANVAIRVVRRVIMIRTDPLMNDLRPTAPYKPPPRVALRKNVVEIEEGLRPEKGDTDDRLTRDMPLEIYKVPQQLRTTLTHQLHTKKNDGDQGRMASATHDEVVKLDALLKRTLAPANYVERFSTLLHIEELQMEVDIRKYDMVDVHLDVAKEKHLLKLKVPGLSENRPSVLKGDCLFITKLKADKKTEENREYKGYVHEVGQNEVSLGFSENFRSSWLKNLSINCRFVFNRLPQRLQHRAVVLSREHSLSGFLFPTSTTVCTRMLIQPLDTELKFYNRQVEQNIEQSLAVRNIVSGSSRPAPFLVFGPPGTGKTVTIVEAMKQVWRCIPSARILACAPSNNAADLLAKRLLDHVDKKLLLRMNAASRDKSTVMEGIRECCNYDRNGRIYFAPKKEYESYKFVVCTLVTAGRLVSANFPPGFFTHIFIDEAGQAVEPESVIPIAGIFEMDAKVPDGGQVVLAGDPEQLGAVLRSPIAIEHGLGVSLLERLMKSVDVYKRRDAGAAQSKVLGSYDTRLLVKLIRNYRSHPAILKVPNESFYDNELEPHADKLVRESLCMWENLPKKGFPIIFHGVVGKEEREERSPSFFNTTEISVVKTYIDSLLENRKGFKVLAKDIGIIAPYRRQVQKFRSVLSKPPFNEITVGSVEEFQGQERRIIIISTVRSSDDNLGSDYHFKLGFLKNPKTGDLRCWFAGFARCYDLRAPGQTHPIRISDDYGKRALLFLKSSLRFNVAVTRPVALLIVVGNPLILVQDAHWKKFLCYCVENGAYKGFELDPNLLKDDNDDDNDDDDGGLLDKFAKLDLNEETLGVSEVTEHIEPEWRGDL